MYLIIGLGNPEEEYKLHRHNTGWIVLDYILGKVKWNESIKGKTLFHRDTISKKQVEYLKPISFMNNSGYPVSYIQIKNKVKSQNIIVIYDDLDLPIGTFKISFNKNSGGHKGLESIIKKMKSKEFVRIRVGISKITPSGKLKKVKRGDKILKFLLGNYKEDELKTLKKISKKINEAVEMIVTEGHQKAMSIYNSL